MPTRSAPILALLLLAAMTLAAHAQQPSDQDAKKAAVVAEQQAATAAADKASIAGPKDIPLIDQGRIDLPAGYFFVPRDEAARYMRAYGNTVGADFLGIAYPASGGAWFATLNFVKAGYVKDEEAKDWNADALLRSLKEGTDAANADRRERGFGEIEVRDWVEKPAYDAATHRLVWSALVAGKGQAADTGSVNYNTYALGREGYFSLDLITEASKIAADKSHAATLLTALKYDLGKGYNDFNAATDKVAEYGIAALIAGVAAKKLGLFALIAAFVLKFAKVFAVGAAAVGYGVLRFFRRKPDGGAAA